LKKLEKFIQILEKIKWKQKNKKKTKKQKITFNKNV
jgi:hypothetical protein